jgi:hypothetical protein
MSTATHTTTIGDIARTRHLRIPFALCFAASMANAVSGNQIKGAYLNEMFLSFGVPQVHHVRTTRTHLYRRNR